MKIGILILISPDTDINSPANIAGQNVLTAKKISKIKEKYDISQ
jgi:hypothetical protein